MSKTSTVVRLFPQNNLLLKNNARQTSSLAKVYEIPLQAKFLAQPTASKSRFSWLLLMLIVLAHAVTIYVLATQQGAKKVEVLPAKPMVVSLIAPPAPEPEIVPIIQLPKPVIKPKPLVKKVVEKIKPIERPAERQVQAVVEQPVIEDKPVAQVAPAEVAEVVKAPPKSEPIVEDKIELPRFGVSYLNNPAPDYPPLSRRMGEEGRVLIKVLVAIDGSASEVQLENSSGSDRLDKAALNAVKRWQFIPAKKNNQPLSAYVLVPIKFSLDS